MTPARVVLLVAIGLYLACLPLNAFCVAGKCSDWPGWSILVFGALMIGAADANTVWLANPLLFIAWGTVFSGHRLVALLFGLAALVGALGFLSFRTVVTNEGGLAAPITGYALGYWLWIASMVVTVIAALMLRPDQARQ